MKNGFTLVELSIVLVIIGLLIGGILVGQSLVDSAKLKSFISQIQQFDIAVNNFKQKFKGLPGDSSKFNGSCGGNYLNNSIIEEGTDVDNNYFNCEIAKFWQDLSVTELSGTDYTSTYSTKLKIGGNGANVPQAKWGDKTGIIGSSNSGAFDLGVNIFSIANFVGSASGFIPGGGTSNAFKPSDIAAFDTKFDDGVATSGDIRAYDGTQNLGALANQSSGGLNNGCLKQGAMPQNYDTGTPTLQCSIAIRMLSQSGQ